MLRTECSVLATGYISYYCYYYFIPPLGKRGISRLHYTQHHKETFTLLLTHIDFSRITKYFKIISTIFFLSRSNYQNYNTTNHHATPYLPDGPHANHIPICSTDTDEAKALYNAEYARARSSSSLSDRIIYSLISTDA